MSPLVGSLLNGAGSEGLLFEVCFSTFVWLSLDREAKSVKATFHFSTHAPTKIFQLNNYNNQIIEKFWFMFGVLGLVPIRVF